MSNQEQYQRHIATITNIIDVVSAKTRASALELVFFASFVFNFALARLMHLTSPTEEVYNYYNDKRNVFNQVFVKKGWLWTTVVIVVFYAAVLARVPNKVAVVRRAVINYVVVTIWWIFFTQWFGGLPIMDRVFVLTGGGCVVNQPTLPTFVPHGNQFKLTSVSSYSCRRLRGSWQDGHDPSGHVFLLTHSSLYLFLETAPFWVSWTHLASGLRQVRHDVRAAVHHPHLVVMPLVGLWVFMLFMTNVYFHSTAEKFVGLLFGYAVVLPLYYIERRRNE